MWSGEVLHTSKDGRVLTVEARLQLQDFDGRRLVLETTHDITDRKAWEARQRLLLSELTHRVKNTLAVVQAIAHQTGKTAGSAEEFVKRFDGRLQALSATHALLIQSDWRGADLASLAHAALEPYATGNPQRIKIAGEPIALSPDLATPFGLVFHELATNAAKYGALSRQKGTVEIGWRVDGGGNRRRSLEVSWREHGGPPAKPPKKAGFGSSLIESGIPGATVKREFLAEGLACTIKLPLPEPSKAGKSR
jgi:two-component system CheB/CheR fusion protein